VIEGSDFVSDENGSALGSTEMSMVSIWSLDVSVWFF
jgi:hypothetical protein